MTSKSDMKIVIKSLPQKILDYWLWNNFLREFSSQMVESRPWSSSIEPAFISRTIQLIQLLFLPKLFSLILVRPPTMDGNQAASSSPSYAQSYKMSISLTFWLMHSNCVILNALSESKTIKISSKTPIIKYSTYYSSHVFPVWNWITFYSL